jgi:single-stranded DNA-binding protein
MYSLNRATLIGNLTREPEMRQTPGGKLFVRSLLQPIVPGLGMMVRNKTQQNFTTLLRGVNSRTFVDSIWQKEKRST